jgi:menaquinol-cytochrome c reductase iron-sulfur subunit
VPEKKRIRAGCNKELLFMEPTSLQPPVSRRSFLKWAIHGLGALFGLILGLPAVAYLIDARNRPARDTGFKTVARLSELQVGVPHQVVLHDVRRDAWTLHPNDVIGRVWLVRRKDNKVDAFTTICPHLGCSVNFQSASKNFVCPCHGGTFDLDGKRVERQGFTNPAPRGMDRLPIQITEDPDAGHRLAAGKPELLIAVKYQNFIQGKDTPILKS